MFSTAIEFAKLEKVGIGGMKGRILSHDVDQIFAEFQENFATFANSTYDGLDPDQKVRSRRFRLSNSLLFYQNNVLEDFDHRKMSQERTSTESNF